MDRNRDLYGAVDYAAYLRFKREVSQIDWTIPNEGFEKEIEEILKRMEERAGKEGEGLKEKETKGNLRKKGLEN